MLNEPIEVMESKQRILLIIFHEWLKLADCFDDPVRHPRRLSDERTLVGCALNWKCRFTAGPFAILLNDVPGKVVEGRTQVVGNLASDHAEPLRRRRNEAQFVRDVAVRVVPA